MRARIVVGALALCLSSQPLFGQAPSQPVAPAPSQPAGEEAAPAPAQPWAGTVAQGFAKMRELAEKQQLESARTVADALLAPNSFLRWKLDVAERGGWRKRAVDFVDPVLDLAGWNGLEPDVRAEVWYAKGVIASLDKDRESADAAFWKARGMSSDVTLQRDAIYDVGVLALQAGEAERAKLPEVSGKPAQPAMPMPPMPGQPGAGSPLPGQPGAAPPPDPLQLARAAYLEARGHFVERLRSEWNDADTQANVELCLKRLRELDEIEKKRKEEEQKKKDQEKKDKQDQQKQDQKDKQDKKDENKDEADKDQQKQDPDKPKEDEKKPEDKKPQDQPDEEKKKDEKKDAQPTEAKDDQMSQAEITQLLDRLQRLEEEWKKLQAQIKAARRVKVKRDW